MRLVGLEHLLAIVEGVAFEGKMVINERGAVYQGRPLNLARS